MRWLFVLLLLANVGLFAWYQTQPPVTVAPGPGAAGEGLEPLPRRLADAGEAQPRPPAPQRDEAPRQPQTPGYDEPPTESPAPVPESSDPEDLHPDFTGGDIEPQPAPGEPDGAHAQPEASAPRAAEPPRAERLPPEPAEPRTAQPPPEQEQAPATAPTPSVAAPPPAPQPKRICLRSEPIRERDDAQRLADRLRTGGDVSVREQTGFVEHHWVHIPAPETRAEAQRILATMRQQGYRDYYLIPSGESANIISLGVFSARENALRRMRQIQALTGVPRPILGSRRVEQPIWRVTWSGDPAHAPDAAAAWRPVACDP